MKTRRFLIAPILAIIFAAGTVTVTATNASAADLIGRVNEMWDRFNGQYNVIAYKRWQGSHWEVKGLKTCETRGDYTTVVFKEGWFTRGGDGGYQNWAFRGNFMRRDRYVEFYPLADVPPTSVVGCA